MGRILRLHASFISTRKPSYNGLPMPLGQALGEQREREDQRAPAHVTLIKFPHGACKEKH